MSENPMDSTGTGRADDPQGGGHSTDAREGDREERRREEDDDPEGHPQVGVAAVNIL